MNPSERDQHDESGAGWETGLVLAILLLGAAGAVLWFAPRLVVSGRRMPSRLPCIHNLKELDGAKEQWALENKKTVGAIPDLREVCVFLKNSVMPQCPTKGVYRLNPVGVTPTCSRGAAEGHTI